MRDKPGPSDAHEASDGSVCKDQQIDMAADEVSIAAANLSDGNRRVGAVERMQLKIAKTLGLPPASLSEGSLHASPRTVIESGAPDTWPGQVPEAECLALVRAVNQIRDPGVRRTLLQMVEAAVDHDQV